MGGEGAKIAVGLELLTFVISSSSITVPSDAPRSLAWVRVRHWNLRSSFAPDLI